MDGLEDLGKLIYGLDSEFSGGSSCGIGNFGIFGVSRWFKDYGDAGIPVKGGIEGRNASILAEDGIEGCVFLSIWWCWCTCERWNKRQEC